MIYTDFLFIGFGASLFFSLPCFCQGRVNREVAGKKGAVETGVKRGLKKAHKP